MIRTISVVSVAVVLSSVGAVHAVGGAAAGEAPLVLVPAATYVRGLRAALRSDRFEVQVDAFFIDQDEVTEGPTRRARPARRAGRPP